MESLQNTLGITLLTIGEIEITLLDLLWVVVVFVVAFLVSAAQQRGLNRLSRQWSAMNRGSVYSLGRVLHYVILVLALVIGLASLGFNFTNAALVLGALGVGIGFGLQSVAANFVSGLIILFERPVKVGDFIEFQSGVAGEVREIRMRAVRITTNDNVDILVPNVEFTNGRVVNWTMDDQTRRIRVGFGVAYGSDKELVRKVILEAAGRVPHTLSKVPGRDPQVWLVKFGESSLNFELLVWVTPDALRRPGKVQADYLWEIHGALVENGIEIPFPQRDVYLHTVDASSD